MYINVGMVTLDNAVTMRNGLTEVKTLHKFCYILTILRGKTS